MLVRGRLARRGDLIVGSLFVNVVVARCNSRPMDEIGLAGEVHCRGRERVVALEMG